MFVALVGSLQSYVVFVTVLVPGSGTVTEIQVHRSFWKFGYVLDTSWLKPFGSRAASGQVAVT